MIPDFQTIMLPLLEIAGQHTELTTQETYRLIAEHFQLTNEEKAELLPSKTQALYQNRTGWAKSYLTKAGLLEMVKRGIYRISDEGKKVLESKPEKINIAFLNQFEAFQGFRTKSNGDSDEAETSDSLGKELEETTPEEAIQYGVEKINRDLSDQLLTIILDRSPAFFEKLVVDLLIAMGYGGSKQEAGKVLGQSGDEGIDGIINEDKLGFDVIYLQAKRWQRESVVGRPEIQKFAGALMGQRAKKGIFITTSRFTKDAKEYVNHIDAKIILVDGVRLASLMIEYNLGVSAEQTYVVKRVDSDYFDEE